jgi:molecular chaperone DnaK (HSP70)
MMLGIDFGTSQLSAAWVGPDGSPALVADKLDPEVFATPSCVCLEGDRAHAGRAAEMLADENPTWPAARRIKASLGAGTAVMTDARGEPWLPETAVALLLRKIADDAKLVLGRKPERAVIAVPRAFTAAERTAVWRAADWAGLNQVCLMDDGLAAARFFAMGEAPPAGPVLLFVAGARQVEARVLTLPDGGFNTRGAASGLGGESDQCDQLFARIAPLLGGAAEGAARGPAPRAMEKQLQRLLRANPRENVEQVFLQRGRPTIVNLLPAQVARAVEPALGQMLAVAGEALQEAGVGWRDLAAIWPLGCCALQPLLLNALAERLGRPVTARQPLQAAVFGAALHGADLAAGRPWIGLPRPPGRPHAAFGLRTRDAGGKARFDELIPAAAPRPAKAARQFMTSRADQVRMVFELTFMDAEGLEPAGVMAFGPIPRPKLHLPVELQVALDARGELNVEAVDVSSGAKLPRTIVTKGLSSEPFIHQRQLLDSVRLN